MVHHDNILNHDSIIQIVALKHYPYEKQGEKSINNNDNLQRYFG